MGDWEKILVVRQAGVDGDSVWVGDMKRERKRWIRKLARQIHKMDFGGGERNAQVYD